MQDKEQEKQFYEGCAEILGGQTEYRPYPFHKKTRWNARTNGNGRFPGFGIIRLFGNRVHVSLRNPAMVNQWFETPAEALTFLKALPRD